MKKLLIWTVVIAAGIIAYHAYIGIGPPRLDPGSVFPWLEDHEILSLTISQFLTLGAYPIWYLGLDPNTQGRLIISALLSWWGWLSLLRVISCYAAKLFGLNSPRAARGWRSAFFPWRFLYPPCRRLSDWRGQFNHGKRATSSWASPLELMYLLYRPGMSYAGTIEFVGVSGNQPVACKSQGHEMIFGMTGSGKSNLAIMKRELHEGSTIIVDPAGGINRVQFRRLGKGAPGIIGKEHKSFWIGPPRQDEDIVGPSACWNPMDEIDRVIKRTRDPGIARRVVASHAEGVIIKEPGENKPFFPNSARGIWAGVEMFVYATEPPGSPRRNFIRVLQLISNGDRENMPEGMTPWEWLLFQMSQHKEDYGGVIATTAAWLLRGGRESTRDIISTVMSQTQWLTFPEMQAIITRSDFSFEDFKYGDVPHHLAICAPISDVHDKLAPWLRLIVTSVIDTYEKTPGKGKADTLLIVDELASLGCIPSVEKGPAYLRRHGLKFIGISQDVGTLGSVYRNLDGMIGNADAIYWFRTDAESNFEALMKKLAEATRREKIEGGLLSKTTVRMQDVERPLMYRNQLSAYLVRHMIVTRAIGRPMKLSVPHYYRELPVWTFDVDPDHAEFPLRALMRRLIATRIPGPEPKPATAAPNREENEQPA